MTTTLWLAAGEWATAHVFGHGARISICGYKSDRAVLFPAGQHNRQCRRCISINRSRNVINEQIEYLKTVVGALSTRLVAVEAAAELGCAAHAVGIEMEAWAADEELTIVAYALMLDRAVNRARRMMAGEECPSCASEGMDPLLHSVSRNIRAGVFPSVHR